MSLCWGRPKHKLDSQDSPFDLQVLSAVANALKTKVCRNDPNVVRRRRLEGSMGLLVQCANELVDQMREVGERGQQVMAEPDPDAFNFTKADAQERLFSIFLSMEGRFTGVPVTVFQCVSPICKVHVKVVPKCDSLLPHYMTEDLLLYGLTYMAKSERLDLRLVFDSLATRAEINHFHYDGLYLGSTGLKQSRFPIELVDRAAVTGELTPGNVAIELLQEMQWYTRGFVVTAGGKPGDSTGLFPKGDIESLARVAASLVAELQRRNIPHTILLCPALQASIPKKIPLADALAGNVEFAFPMTPEVFILPRALDEEGPGTCGVELAGLILARTEDDYGNITEAATKQYMNSAVMIKEKLFDEILCKAAWLSN